MRPFKGIVGLKVQAVPILLYHFFSEWKCHFSSATTEFGNTCTIFLDHRGRDLCKVAMPRELKQLRKQPDLVDQYVEAFAQEERLKTVLASVSFQWSGMLSLN